MPKLAANGIEIAYETAGRESDPALLFIMGLGASMVAWPDQLFYGLADRGFRVIRFDNRDAGQSTRFSALGAADVPALLARLARREPAMPPYTLADMAADAAALLDGLGIGSAHVAGVSMGGMIGQQLALDHPGKVKSLISIMSTSGRPGLPPADPAAWAALMTPAKSAAREDRIASTMAFIKIISGAAYAPSEAELRDSAERAIDYAPYDPPAVSRQTAGVMGSPLRFARLAEIKAPTLVIHGTHDPLLPLPHGEDTAACIPGSRLKVIEGFAHGVGGPAIPLLTGLISDFAAEVEARG